MWDRLEMTATLEEPTLAPSTCLACWLAAHTYSPREVRMLPADDPRRARVRDPRRRARQ